jgi:triphosphoribosyl-dephospho-CoA synthase
LQCAATRFLALLCELAAWPGLGLVSRVDSGSYQDVDAAIMKASANSLRAFFAELATAGQDGAAQEAAPTCWA